MNRMFLNLQSRNDMAETDDYLLERLRRSMKTQNASWEEKRMFGGNCFMVDDKMCFGTYKGGLMARVNPEEVDELIKKEGADQMIHAGRIMTGYLFIEESGYDMDDDLDFWVKKCLEFNPLAKSSKKKN